VNITPAASNSTILWTTTARQYQEGLLSVAAGDVLPTYPVDADAFGPVCGPEFPQLFSPLSRDPPGRIISCHHRESRLLIHAPDAARSAFR
jgi:hypothetical protein